MCRTIHIQAVEVQTRALITQRVFDVDDNLIAFGSDNRWNWPLAIDSDDRPIILAVRIGVCPRYVEVICDSRCTSCRNKKRDEKKEV